MENQDVWSTSNFYFSVDIGDQKNIPFQEVSGLDTERQAVSRRQSSEFSTMQLSGVSSSGNVVLKNGLFIKDNTFWNWYNEIKINIVKHEVIVIRLLNENRDTAIQWTLKNAFPAKISDVELKSDGNEVVVESLEIACETIEITNT